MEIECVIDVWCWFYIINILITVDLHYQHQIYKISHYPITVSKIRCDLIVAPYVWCISKYATSAASTACDNVEGISMV
ncbi:MAG: hypothetical protein IPI23_17530 [Bacteroidetes bacterium]|nr:hypothetical protein [Bacteroidota bacterium]